MIDEIYVEGTPLDLDPFEGFTYVMQVNDLFDLKTRQASYGETRNIMPTPKMLELFELLGAAYPHNSGAPYRRLNTDYLIDGIPVVMDAFGIIRSTENGVYKFHFYDGNVDLYQAVEKLKITDLAFDEFTHVKNIAGVVETWENDLDYVYAVADYGGIPEHDGGINIDFLVPSVSLKWVFNKIFESTGFAYEISPGVLDNKYFTISDAYKDVSAPGAFDAVYESRGYLMADLSRYNDNLNKYAAPVSFFEGTAGDATWEDAVAISHTVENTGFYDFEIDVPRMYPALAGAPFGTVFELPNLALSIDVEGSEVRSILPNSIRSFTVNEDRDAYELFGRWINIELEAGQTLHLVAIWGERTYIIPYTFRDTLIIEEADMRIIYKPEDQVALPNYLSDLPVKDLFSEVLVQNALTPIRRKNTNTYRFYTLDERLGAPVIDWSDKYIRTTKEYYQVGDYGRSNKFKYKYNEDGENHNDGEFLIDSVQIKDETVIKSKFYGAEREPTFFETLQTYLPKFLLWKENIKERNGTQEVEYKELKNHYHWLETSTVFMPTKVTSKAFGTSGTASRVKVANFDPFKWDALLDRNYSRILDLLGRASLIEVEVDLSPLGLQEFDFFCRIYIEELSSVFIPNKIINKTGEDARVELIKIQEWPKK